MNQTFEVRKIVNCTLFIPLNKNILSSTTIYFPKYNILVDPGNPISTPDLIAEMRKNEIEPDNVKHILCTHLHIDHLGAYWLFPQAKLYASQEEIDAFMTNSRYFQIDEQFSSATVKCSLIQALRLISEHPYEKALNRIDFFLEKFHSSEQIASGKNGFFVFPSHTPGSTVIVIDGVVCFGDIFSLDSRLDWIPKKYKEKIQLFHAGKVYGKQNLISGHIKQESEMAELNEVPSIITKGPSVSQGNVNKNTNDYAQPRKVHQCCDEDGRIIAKYYCDDEGNKIPHKDGYYEIRYLYNKLGKIHRELYFDIDGYPIANKYGSYGAQYNYNDKGQWVLYTELDQNYQLRKNEESHYFCSVYYYSNVNDSQIIARVDFKHYKITKIKYIMDDFIIDQCHAFERYHQLFEMLENYKLS